MNPVTQPLGECPCGMCALAGTKLTKFGHLVGCTCASCRGRRNKRKGRASEARAWKQLGAPGPTRNDDSYFGFPLVASIENKVGQQIPAKFTSFVDSEWLRRAMFQAQKKIPVGEEAYPTVRLELSPSRAYLVVDISVRKDPAL